MRSWMPCSQRVTRSGPFHCFNAAATCVNKFKKWWHRMYYFIPQVLPPPAGYVPIRTPARKLSATPTPIGGMTGFHMQVEDRTTKQMNDQPSGNLPFLKPDDIQYFDKLLVSTACTENIVNWGSLSNLNFNMCVHVSVRWRWMSPPWAPRSRKKERSWSCCWRLKMEHLPWERLVAGCWFLLKHS